MKLTVAVEGVDDIENSANYLKKAVAGALESVAIEGAFVIRNEARALCPVKTGRLQKSIRYEVQEKSPTRVVVSVRPRTPYAGRIERGFMDKDRLGRQFHQPAEPYMRPAFDAKQQEARDTMQAAAQEAIRDALIEASNRSSRRRR